MTATMNINFRRALLGLGIYEALCLIAYSTIVLCLVPFHEPWTDEAQGWLISSNSSLHTILGRVLHYEVAPPLWQFTLYPLVKLHLGFRSASWLTAGLGILAAFVVLRYSPFPRLLRCLLPFTFFLQYQYALIARPYAWFPLLLFILCLLYRRGESRSLLFALTAGLLANINLHCTVYAPVLFAVCFWSKDGSQGKETSQTNFFTRARLPIVGAAVFGSALVVAVLVAFPAPDQFMSGSLQRLKTVTARIVPPEQTPAGMIVDPPEQSANRTPAPRLSHSVKRLAQHAVQVGLGTLSAILFPVSQSNLLSAAFLILCGAWLTQRRQGIMLLPLAGMVLAYFILPVAAYHTGLFFVAVFGALWMAWPEQQTLESSRLFLAFATVCAVTMLVQISWALRADANDIRGDYDPSATTARYLQAYFPSKTIAAFSYETEPVQLYAPIRPIGWQRPFWTWSVASEPNSYKESIRSMHPDLVLTGSALVGSRSIEQQIGKKVEGRPVGNDATTWWETRGWRVTHRFCGKHFGYGGYTDQACINILEPPRK